MMQEAPTPPCDVIILTALPVECQAVLRSLQERQEENVHPSGTVYYRGTFPGKHRTWRVAVAEIGPRGPTAATETERAISYFRPQITLFVGVGGGLKDVKLGDVVVATKVYAYEAGKVVEANNGAQQFQPHPEVWRASYALLQRARAERHNSKWLTRLEGSCPNPAPEVYIGPLAAGEKVLASTRSDLFRLLKATRSDALAVEMEGHGFLAAVYANHGVHGLVIRGISDLIDGKSATDATGSQTVAAQHAAAFAFQVLANFSPTQDDSTTPTLPAYWNVPYAHNRFFTGREEILERLHTGFHTSHATALSQPQALSGLGGVGKTQIAVEYAHRYRQNYQAVLWASAANVEDLNSSYVKIAEQLNLREKNEQEQEKIVQAVKRWLQNHSSWLLVLDNADDPSLLAPFLPSIMGGHLLLTTRTSALGGLGLGIAHPITIETFTMEQGALFLLRRSCLLDSEAPLEQAKQENQQLARQITHELGGLPLALDQAGAYIEETGARLADYLRIYQQHYSDLLKRRGLARDYPQSVATTWSLSFEKVKQRNPGAADLLRLCAFHAPDAIPKEILATGAIYLGIYHSPHIPDFIYEQLLAEDGLKFGRIISELAKDPSVSLWLDQAIEVLRTYSLVTCNSDIQTLTVHRLVQTILRDTLPDQTRRTWKKLFQALRGNNPLFKTQPQWKQRVVLALNAALPYTGFTHWSECERYLPHVLLCATWIEQAQITTTEATSLLSWAGGYLATRARYEEAEPLLLRALAIREQHWNPLYQDHPDPLAIASILTTLGRVHQELGKYVQAESCLQRALAIYEDQEDIGDYFEKIPTSLNILASLYVKQEKYAEAELCLQRALTIHEQEQQLELKVLDWANTLADLKMSQGKYAETESLFQQALAILDRPLHTIHSHMRTSLNNLALLYLGQGEYAQAELLYQRALSIYEKQLGVGHLDTANCLYHLTILYCKQGKYAEAESLYRDALPILEQQLGRDHPVTKTFRENYATFLQMMSGNVEAEKLEEDS